MAGSKRAGGGARGCDISYIALAGKSDVVAGRPCRPTVVSWPHAVCAPGRTASRLRQLLDSSGRNQNRQSSRTVPNDLEWSCGLAVNAMGCPPKYSRYMRCAGIREIDHICLGLRGPSHGDHQAIGAASTPWTWQGPHDNDTRSLKLLLSGSDHKRARTRVTLGPLEADGGADVELRGLI